MSGELLRFEDIIRNTLCSLANMEVAWSQDSLPVRWGGLGVMGVVAVSPSAFLASWYSSEQLVCQLLPGWALSSPGHLVTDALAAWTGLGGSAVP